MNTSLSPLPAVSRSLATRLGRALLCMLLVGLAGHAFGQTAPATTKKPAATKAPAPPKPAEEKAPVELKSAAEILQRVDEQMTFDTRSMMAKMIIVTPEETREKEMKIFARGEEDSFIAFLKPARDKGTKILKLQQQLWTYFPRGEKTVKISGHMLRQSMMGSDLSYEDLTENKKLLELYNVTLIGSEKVDGEDSYVLELTEKKKGTSYPKIKQWVSKRHLVPVREERYANTGRLLKVMRMTDIRQHEGRYYPTRIIVEDKLKKGTRTELVLDQLKFGAQVPQEAFEIRNLDREIAL
jgi:outer membrane lipoprotein-sorting protein